MGIVLSGVLRERGRCNKTVGLIATIKSTVWYSIVYVQLKEGMDKESVHGARHFKQGLKMCVNISSGRVLLEMK